MSFEYALPADWRWSTLDEAKAEGRSIVSGPFGSNIGKRFFVESGVPVIRGNNLTLGMGRFKDDGFVYLSKEKALEFRNCEAHPGDLLFTAAGTIGQVGIIPPKGKYPKYIISNKQLRARLNSQKFDPLFAYYWFASPDMVTTIQSRNTGSTIPLINLSVIKSLPIPVPPLREQQNIVAHLSLIDDRITLLRETNATLEAIAQSLFKSWFIDFDPVRAKMDGRAPEGMNEAAARLFPDSFEESELGLVPRGWRVGKLADLAEFQNGYAFKSKDWIDSGHPVVKIGDVKPGIIDFSGCSFVAPETTVGLDRFRLNRGDLLAGMTGYVGETGLVAEVAPAAYLNQRVGRIATPNGMRDGGFVYCLARNANFKEYAVAQSHGSAQANVSGSALLGYSTVIPSGEVMSMFNEFVYPILESMLSNHEYAQTLSTLRDALLPRLISGQLQLPEADATVESWLHGQVGPAHDALKADHSRAVSVDQVRARLAAEHADTKSR